MLQKPPHHRLQDLTSAYPSSDYQIIDSVTISLKHETLEIFSEIFSNKNARVITVRERVLQNITMAFAVNASTGIAQTMGDESVAIYVGPKRKRYLIHKNLLTNQSEYFAKALNGKFKEADEQVIYLEEESPAAFDLLVDWLYQDCIPSLGPSFCPLEISEVYVPVKDSFSSEYNLALGSGHGHKFGRLAASYSTPIGNVEMGMGSPGTRPKNEGTSRIAYQPHVVVGPAAIPPAGYPFEVFHHISLQMEYCKWSAEELRVADYEANRKWNMADPLDLLESLGQSSPGSSPFRNSSSSLEAASTQPFPFTTTGYIPGIPRCPSVAEITAAEEYHQLALLQLCLLAESLCWDTLFNRSMSAYFHGEAALPHRALPATHIALIHALIHARSPCRAFAADSAVSHLRDPAAQAAYAELTKEFPGFLEDVFASLGTNPALGRRRPSCRGACAYHVHAEGQSCALLAARAGMCTLASGGSSSSICSRGWTWGG